MAKKQIGRILLAKLEVAGERVIPCPAAAKYILLPPVCGEAKLLHLSHAFLSPSSDESCAQSFAVESQVVIFQDFQSNQTLNFNLVCKCVKLLKILLRKLWLLWRVWKAVLFETCAHVTLDLIGVFIQAQFMLNQSILIRVKRDIASSSE